MRRYKRQAERPDFLEGYEDKGDDKRDHPFARMVRMVRKWTEDDAKRDADS